MTPAIRPAGDDDLDELAELEALCFDSPWSREQLGGSLSAEGAIAVAAEHDGEIVGYALYRRVADEAELLRIAVRPEARRRGLARRLLEAGRDALEASGVGAAFLEVRLGNRAARELYAACGWRLVGRRSGYYRDGSPALLYRLELEPAGR